MANRASAIAIGDNHSSKL
ncbi:hypothetical protein [Mannheimia haemolytica]